MQHREFELRTLDGTRLFAQSWTPVGTPLQSVAVIHGLGEHSGRYAEMAGVFASAGLQVVSFDQRGHGRTGGRLPSFYVLRDDIHVLLDMQRREGFQRPVLLGQSMGGGLVLSLVLQQSTGLSAAVAMSPMIRTAFPPPYWKLFVARWLGRVWPGLTLNSGINANHLSHDPEAIRAYLGDPLVHHRISAALGLTMLESGEHVLEIADRWNLPLLLMHGTDDRITSSQASQAFAKKAGTQCTLMLWEDLAHDLHHECERLGVLHFVADWILRQSEPSANRMVD
ncbi:MAG: lysophospholipase [Planctomycetota bacterium]